MESRKVIKGLKAQCENTGTDHKHDELCGMVEDLRSRLMKTQKEKIALLEEKLCGLCEEKTQEKFNEDEATITHFTKEIASLSNSGSGNLALQKSIDELRARLMKTSSEVKSLSQQ